MRSLQSLAPLQLGRRSTDAMDNSGLHGTWQLTSIYSTTSSGDKSYFFGSGAMGRLTYTPNGFMNVFIMKKDRPVFEGGKIDEGTPEEIRAAFQSFDAYCGRYSIDQTNKTVTHHVEMARSPAWTGIDLVRYFELDGTKLSIYTPEFYSDAQGENVVVYLNWEKCT